MDIGQILIVCLVAILVYVILALFIASPIPALAALIVLVVGLVRAFGGNLRI